jgi:fructokinase
MTALVIGEVLVDLVWRTGTDQIVPHPGGSPANVALGLHRLGRPVTLMTCWGNDPAGALVQTHLAGTGMNVRRIENASARTTIALAYIDETSRSATYDFMTAWDPGPLPVAPGVTLLHTGSLAGAIAPGAERVLDACRQVHGRPGRAVSVDLNVRPAALPNRDTYRDAAERLTRVADIVKASDEDLHWLYPGIPPTTAARALLDLGPRLAVVTHGPHGATAITTEHDIHVAAPAVDVVDTIGAGDAFQASLLDTLLGADTRPDAPIHIPTTTSQLHDLLRRCTTAGAITCNRVGAEPPTRHEIQAALHIA